ncbi:MAG: helix-turn-helix domain-containing protein, partial [Candidatus Sulfotelmatobacter sp.]
MNTTSKKIISIRRNFVTFNSAGMSRRHKLRLSHRYAGQFAAGWGSFVGTFGEKFREERERRGFTLDDISNVTKINSRMLQAIEQEQFDVLPGGVFNKGFIRAYAKVLGFNPEDAITGYLGALRQAQLDAQTLAWDQPLPSRTTAGAIQQAMPKAPLADASRVVEKSAPLAGFKWTTIKPVAGPVISQPSASIPSPLEESPQPPTSHVSAKPEPLVPPPPAAPEIAQPAAIQPPPLWIPPSPVSRPTMSASSSSEMSAATTPVESSHAPSPSPATPSFVREETQHPPAAPIAQQQSSLRILIDEPAAEPRPPNNPLPEPRKKYAAAAGVLPPQRTAAASWKIPALILAFAAIVIVALLANRNPRHVTVQNPEPAPSSPAPAPQASSATNAARQSLPSPAAAPA